MKLNLIRWGDDCGEHDNSLMKYFVDDDSLNRLKTRSKTFIIGRKGSGKSAMRKRLMDEFLRVRDIIPIEVIPDYALNRGMPIQSVLNESFCGDLFFQYSWLKHLYDEAIDILANRLDVLEKNSKLRDLVISRSATRKNFLALISDYLKRLTFDTGKLGKLEIEIDTQLRKEADIDEVEKGLREILNRGYQIVWIVDDPDWGWDNSEAYNKFLLGLLLAKNYLKNLSPGFHTFICIREDVYEILLTKTQHSDKYRDKESISWDATKLQHMLEMRIRHNFEVFEYNGANKGFLSVFPEKVGSSRTINWLNERTLNRPRELLQLVRLYTEKNDTEFPSDSLLKAAEAQYSKDKLTDLCTEFTNEYPDLLKAFGVWKKKHFKCKYHLTRDACAPILTDIFMSADIDREWFATIREERDYEKMLAILYEIGFIGDFIRGRGSSKVVYSFSDKMHEPLFNEIEIHPCFRKAIGTAERMP